MHRSGLQAAPETFPEHVADILMMRSTVPLFLHTLNNPTHPPCLLYVNIIVLLPEQLHIMSTVHGVTVSFRTVVQVSFGGSPHART